MLAQEEARLLNHNYIGTEHLLLGLIEEEEGVAARVLESLDVSLADARAQVEEIIGHGGQSPSGHIPFTPRAKKVLEMALREALQLGHNYIGTEHILLGLIREGEGVAAQVLSTFGLDLTRVRQAVIQVLSGNVPERAERRDIHRVRSRRAALRRAGDVHRRGDPGRGVRILRCSVAAVRHAAHWSDGRLDLRALHPRRVEHTPHRRAGAAIRRAANVSGRGPRRADHADGSTARTTRMRSPRRGDRRLHPAWGTQRRRRSRCRTSSTARTWASVSARFGMRSETSPSRTTTTVELVKFRQRPRGGALVDRHARRTTRAPSS